MTDLSYKESMFWITQFQTFRKESAMIKSELQHTDLVDKIKIEGLLKKIVSFNSNLDETEEVILASLNNGKVYWPGHNHSYDYSKKAKSKNELFDKVKIVYNDFLELQRSATFLFQPAMT